MVVHVCLWDYIYITAETSWCFTWGFIVRHVLSASVVTRSHDYITHSSNNKHTLDIGTEHKARMLTDTSLILSDDIHWLVWINNIQTKIVIIPFLQYTASVEWLMSHDFISQDFLFLSCNVEKLGGAWVHVSCIISLSVHVHPHTIIILFSNVCYKTRWSICIGMTFLCFTQILTYYDTVCSHSITKGEYWHNHCKT